MLSIVIPVFNKFNFTRSCLQDLQKLSENHEIIVVDNGSTDQTQVELEKMERIKYLRNQENFGFAKACNRGYQESKYERVLFLNNDIRVSSNHSNWTQPLIDQCDTGLVGPTMGQLDKQLNFVQEANSVLPGNSYMSGWCLASHKNIWEKLDLDGKGQIFSEDYFCYFEDTDLGFRARRAGIKMQVVPVPVVHFGKQSSSQLNVHQLYLKARKIFVSKWNNNV